MGAKIKFYTLIIALFLFMGCNNKPDGYYSASDFGKVAKIDAHFHYDTPDIRYLQFADSLNFSLISPNVDAGMPINKQLEITTAIKRQYPNKFAFLGTFSVDSFNNADFGQQTIAQIKKCMAEGASGIKIWKNIGMVLMDTTDRFVMADDPAFNMIFDYLEKNNIPLLTHLGEPKNCWLPLNEMTVDNDRRYYERHPEYHMYLHPEAPSYEDQIDIRDNLLKKYPDLNHAGAHLGSLEWSVDEIAKRLDQFPNFNIDMAARLIHLQFQSLAEREKVRDFMIKYQDRIMYATDVTLDGKNTNYTDIVEGLRSTWTDHWLFLATDSVIAVADVGGREVKGLQLPRGVIDKVYYKNAETFLNLR